jgi:M6 family metalloprotease-like protein
MKRFATVILIFSFLNINLAEAAVKTGAACSKMNATSTVYGYKYTCIKSGKKFVWSKGVKIVIKSIPTPLDTPTPTATPTPTPTPVATPTPTPITKPTQKTDDIYTSPSELSDNIDLCKIKETNLNGPRRAKGWNSEEAPIFGLPSGFPALTSLTQSTGTVKWALIPIDFVDIPGEKNFRARVDEQMRLLSEWYSTVSEGKLKVEWVVLDKWVTLPGTSNEYKIATSNSPSRSPEIANFWKKAITETDKYFDYTNVQTVNFLLPENQTIVKESLQGFPWDRDLQGAVTNEGTISSFTVAGELFFKPDRQAWSYWAHEFGHAISIAHIGRSMIQSTFQSLDIMGNESDGSKELSGWLRFVAGWMPTERIFCQTSSKITKTEITLVPLSSQENGIKMTIIPLFDDKALIVESRRTTKFSCKNPISSDGVLVYIYDANLSHQQDFLIPIYPSGRSTMRGNCSNLPYLDLLLHEGEKVTIEGITVEVVSHGKYDKIVVSKK